MGCDADLVRLLLVSPLPTCRLGHLLDGLFDVLPLLVQVALRAVRCRVVIRLGLGSRRYERQGEIASQIGHRVDNTATETEGQSGKDISASRQSGGPMGLQQRRYWMSP